MHKVGIETWSAQRFEIRDQASGWGRSPFEVFGVSDALIDSRPDPTTVSEVAGEPWLVRGANPTPRHANQQLNPETQSRAKQGVQKARSRVSGLSTEGRRLGPFRHPEIVPTFDPSYNGTMVT
jgi:hypothetical protein